MGSPSTYVPCLDCGIRHIGHAFPFSNNWIRMTVFPYPLPSRPIKFRGVEVIFYGRRISTACKNDSSQKQSFDRKPNEREEKTQGSEQQHSF